MTVMISHHETLFPSSKDVLPSPPSNKAENQKNTPRSFVGWESAEVRGDQNPFESQDDQPHVSGFFCFDLSYGEKPQTWKKKLIMK